MSTLRDIYDEGVRRFNAGDIDATSELYAEDAVLVTPDGTFEGRAAIHQFWKEDKATCPDSKSTVHAFFEQADAVAGEWTMVGTNTGPVHLPDGTVLPATGRHVEVHGMELRQFRDGKVVRHHVYWDNMGFARQLGLLPESATA